MKSNQWYNTKKRAWSALLVTFRLLRPCLWTDDFYTLNIIGCHNRMITWIISNKSKKHRVTWLWGIPAVISIQGLDCIGDPCSGILNFAPALVRLIGFNTSICILLRSFFFWMHCRTLLYSNVSTVRKWYGVLQIVVCNDQIRAVPYTVRFARKLKVPIFH